MADHSQSTVDLRHYLAILWRRKLIILQAVIVIPAVVVALSLAQTKQYTASARIIVESQAATINAVTQQNNGNQSIDDRQIQTLASFVATREIATTALQKMGSDKKPQAVLKQLTVTPDSGANIITVSAKATSPVVAADLANAFASAFVDWRRSNAQAYLTSAIALVQQQIAATKVGSALYLALLDQRSKMEVVKALSTGNVQLGDAAIAPSSPSSPKPLRNGILALGAAVVLGIGLGFLREALDVKLHSVEEIEALTDIPVIGRIPEIAKQHRQSDKLIMLEEPAGHWSEAFRLLRTNLDFVNFNRDVKSVLITSPLPGQGKSTTVVNLSVVLMMAGRKVAIVEGDLRRPTLHRFFHIQNGRGLSSVVAGTATLEEAVHPLAFRDLQSSGPTVTTAAASAKGDGHDGDMPQLSVLPSGPLPPNPGELVTSQQLGAVLHELSDGNDYVFIDAPPMMPVGDAAALAAKVDGVIIIVRLEDSTRDMIRQIESFAARIPARTLGIVVTGAPRSARTDRYRYDKYYD